MKKEKFKERFVRIILTIIVFILLFLLSIAIIEVKQPKSTIEQIKFSNELKKINL